MPWTKWTPAMIDTLLDHLEIEKGDQGLYVTDRRAAIKTVTNLLTTSSTSNPINAKQVGYKFQQLFYHFHDKEHTNINSFFNLGRIVLRPPYNRRLSGSSEIEDDEDTLSDDHGSSDESSAKGSPRHLTRKRTPLETPTSSLRKKSKHDATPRDQSIPSSPRDNSLIVTLAVDPPSSPKLYSPVRDDLRPLPPTNNNEIKNGLSHSLIKLSTAVSSSTGTLFNDNGNRQAQIAVREYLVQDAEAFIPSQKDLSEQRFQVIDQIHSLVLTLGESSRPTYAYPSQHLATTRYDGTPRFYEALADRDFSDLCMHIYGITTEDELWDKMTGSKVCVKVFLNAFLAVAVTEWVFCERHISVPQLLALKTSFPAIESRVKKLSTKLYERLLRESRSNYVKNEKNFEPYVGDLSRRLHETLKPFLECNKILPVHEDYNSWLAGLKALFLGALKFKAQVTLRSGRHYFRFPHVDKTFDPQTMSTQIGDIREGENKVEMGLFPAVIQTSEPLTIMDVPTEETLFNAIVVLQ